MAIDALDSSENFENHPLHDLEGAIAKGAATLTDARGKTYHFGSFFHGYGGSLVQSGNLCFSKRKVQGEQLTELDFKVTHIARLFLDQVIELYDKKTLSKTAFFPQLLRSQSLIGRVSVVVASKDDPDVPRHIFPKKFPVYKITVPSLGKIFIGKEKTNSYEYLYELSDKEFKELNSVNHVQRVVVQSSKAKLSQFYRLLECVGMEGALKPSPKRYAERLKLIQLYRTYFPREATRLERSNATVNLPLRELQNVMVAYSPMMRGLIKEKLSSVRPFQLLPGKVRYGAPVSQELEKGFQRHKLVTAITGEQVIAKTANILKMGLLSRSLREKGRLSQGGINSSSDYYSGSDHSVFIQFLNESMKKKVFEEAYDSPIHLILSLKALDHGCYQSWSDFSGKKFGEEYRNRPTIFELANNTCERKSNHEIMVKERILPEHIETIVVANSEVKEELIKALNELGMVDDKTKSVMGRPIKTFILTRKEYNRLG